jgi:hypothetical protein
MGTFAGDAGRSESEIYITAHTQVKIFQPGGEQGKMALEQGAGQAGKAGHRRPTPVVLSHRDRDLMLRP